MANQGLNGINPLAYMGVNPYTPPGSQSYTRAPTSNDSAGYAIGDFWVVSGPSIPEQIYCLVSLLGGVATWAQLYPGSGSTLEFETDAGSVNPVAGVVNIVGDGVKITTSGSGNTITISADSDVANEFVTDSGTATPSSSVLNVLGGSNINTYAASNTVNIALDPNVSLLGNLDVGGDATFFGAVKGNSLGSPNGGVVQATAGAGILSSSRGTNGQVLIGATGSPPAWANITSSDASVTIVNNANSIDLQVAGGGGGNTIVSTFTSSGTWTKNGSANYIEMYIISAGGGGAAGNYNIGGGGGGSWGSVYIKGPAFCFPASSTVTVGVGGSGGVVGVNNSYGSDGGYSGVDSIYPYVVDHIDPFPYPRNGGGNGINGSSDPGYYGDLMYDTGFITFGDQLAGSFAQNQGRGTGGRSENQYLAKAGLNRGITRYQTVAAGPLFSIGSYIGAGTGGGGAGFNPSSPTTAYSGATGGSIYNFGGSSILVSGGAGGQEGVVLDGTDGADGLQPVGIINMGAGGGGGGNRAIGLTAGNGGNGGFPGGGGGGGGGGTSLGQGGNGGNGADGVVIVIEYT